MKEKISDVQTLWLTLIIILPTIILVVPKTIAQFAGHIAWLSIILAGVSMAILQYIFLKLSFNFSQEGLIADCEKLFGSLLGKILILPYVLIIFDVTTVILFEVVEFMRVIMPKTPLSIFWILIGLMSISFIYAGIEVLARVIEIITIVFLPMFFLILLIIIIKDFNLIQLQRLEPIVLDLKTIIRGSIFPANWFILVPITLVILKPNFNNYQQVLKLSLIGNLLSQLIVIILFIVTISVFGVNLTKILAFPFYSVAKLSIRGFEVMVFVIWLFVNILKVALYYFSSTKLIADLFAIKNHKLLAIPIGILLTIFSYWRAQSSLMELTVRYVVVRNLLFFYLPTLVLLSIAYLLVDNS